MTPRPVIRAITGLLTAVVVLGVAVALAFTAWAGKVDYPFPRAEEVGWLIPVIVAGIVGLLGWALLTPRDRTDAPASPAMVRCDECDAVMMQEWRMCPYCGFLKEGGETTDE